jgi:hypothetical protein
MGGRPKVVRRSTWYCRACHKKAFPSQGSAERVMEHIHVLNPHGHVPTRAYECPYDNGWHLTSQKERRLA